ncbi:spore coat associated protein CotJA [Lachnotalea sp. AF33-28]|uniref:spore coat associated protein CotJA n=1 Tax=Lachnotalea sp. AF33-28 TaxID=2292046 RepID=UPI001FAA4A66|nr:spore coat associated protein CotJA [Lachnotalea sp. AF33-28]
MEYCNNRRPDPRRPMYAYNNPSMMRNNMQDCGCNTAGRTNDRMDARMDARMDTPDTFPVAMAYVPWQRWKEPYDLECGLNKGTIFPELDKPFMIGRCAGR